MFDNFWYTLRDGLLIMIVVAFGAMIVPSSAVFGLHLMTKLDSQLTPACEVRK